MICCDLLQTMMLPLTPLRDRRLARCKGPRNTGVSQRSQPEPNKFWNLLDKDIEVQA
jgi:hypothetical protein